MNFRIIFFVAMAITLGFNFTYAETVVDSDLNLQIIEAPLSVYSKATGYCSSNCNFTSAVFHGESGYSLHGDHSSDDVVIIYDDMANHLEQGIYFSYWVFYSLDYHFPGDTGDFDNLKMTKIAGGDGNIEFIYKQTGDGGPSRLQLYWNRESGGLGGTAASSIDLFPGESTDYSGNKFLTKGVWHKIEVYIEIPISGNHTLHVQVDDVDVYENNNCDFDTPASQYTGTRQIASLRASNSPPSGHGDYYFDDILIVYNEGNLCDTISGTPEPTQPIEAPTNLQIIE